jgi:hypothetical protein
MKSKHHKILASFKPMKLHLFRQFNNNSLDDFWYKPSRLLVEFIVNEKFPRH